MEKEKNRVLDLGFLLILCLLSSSSAYAENKEGDVQRLGDIVFSWCPPGKYIMGTAAEDTPQAGGNPSWYGDEKPAREISLNSGFWLSRHEITQQQWESVMNTRPWEAFNIPGNASLPATGMTGNQCLEFVDKLGKELNKRCRMPSEAEWEYACRSGSTGSFHGEVSDQTIGEFSWHRWNTPIAQVQEVGQKKPNSWGFLDMLGNAWEWTSDLYVPSVNTGAKKYESHFVIRGGGVNSTLSFIRCASRIGYERSTASPFLGLRVLIEE